MSHAYSLWKGREGYRATTAVTLFVRLQCGLYEGPSNLLAFNVKQCVLRTRIRRDSLCRFNDTWPLQITLKKDLEPFPVREEMRILGRQTKTDDQIYLQNKTLEFRSCLYNGHMDTSVYGQYFVQLTLFTARLRTFPDKNRLVPILQKVENNSRHEYFCRLLILIYKNQNKYTNYHVQSISTCFYLYWFLNQNQ